MSKYTTLEAILGKDDAVLNALQRGEFEAEKLGTVAFCEVKQDEYKQIKKDCMKKVLNEKTHQYEDELDDDKLMTKLIIAAVDKETKQPDKRSDFSFANKALLDKLGVVTADGAVNRLMSIGEIYKAATDIQEVCGFTEKAQQEVADDIKNL